MDDIHQGLAPLDFLPYAQLSQDFIDNQNQDQTPVQDPNQTNQPAIDEPADTDNTAGDTTDIVPPDDANTNEPTGNTGEGGTGNDNAGNAGDNPGGAGNTGEESGGGPIQN